MDVYTLDNLLRRSQLIDRYISFIWTERFAEKGDFELVLLSTQQNRRLFQTGVRLATNVSNYVMEVKTVEDTTDQEGRKTLTVKGLSLEWLLEDRVAFGVLDDLTTVPKWIITDEPAEVARKIFHDICVTGVLSLADQIPWIVEGSFLPEGTIPEPVDPITVELEPQTVYQAIKDICDAWSLGFRILRNGDASQLYFDIFAGSDRTTKQDILDAVVFTPELDNLQNTTELNSVDGYKNVAYVFSPAGFAEVYPPNVNPEVEGFERRVLVIKADDITEDTPDVESALITRGNEELSKLRSFAAFDGEINPNNQYKYGTHYYLGDLVEVRNIDGVTNDMRVTEQIFICDSEGERAYPTLTINQFIQTGTWLAWDANKVWEDYTTEHWNEL